MYELVKRILDKSRNENVDVLVACDMCIAEDKPHEEELRAAGELVDEHYDVITKCRRENDDASIEKLCSIIAGGNVSEIRAFEKEIMRR